MLCREWSRRAYRVRSGTLQPLLLQPVQPLNLMRSLVICLPNAAGERRRNAVRSTRLFGVSNQLAYPSTCLQGGGALMEALGVRAWERVVGRPGTSGRDHDQPARDSLSRLARNADSRPSVRSRPSSV